jgi:hypothetical protein
MTVHELDWRLMNLYREKGRQDSKTPGKNRICCLQTQLDLQYPLEYDISHHLCNTSDISEVYRCCRIRWLIRTRESLEVLEVASRSSFYSEDEAAISPIAVKDSLRF